MTRPEPADHVTAFRLLVFGCAVGIVLIFSQAWVFPLLGDNEDAAADSLVRALFFPAYGMALFLAVLAPASAFWATLRQPFLILLMLIVGASITWSVSPDQTLRRVVAIYATTLGGVVLGSRYRWADLAEVLATAFATLAVIAFVVPIAFPSIGIMHELFPGAWRGVWPEKNILGGIMALGFAILAGTAMLNPHRARLWWSFAALCLLLVLLSTSKTSLVALVMGFGTLIFVALVRRSPAIGVATVWLAVLGIGLVASVALFASDILFKALGKDATLTGRTEVWTAAIRQIELRPWTGYGYAAVWDDTDPWAPLAKIVKEAHWRPHHSHNSWIEQWLGLGVFGLASWAFYFLQTMVMGVVAAFRTPGAYLALPFLVIYALTSLTESVAVTYNDFRWVIFVALSVKLCWPDREVRT
nr:O-antigen ligase [Phenylobacterium aquaticum]